MCAIKEVRVVFDDQISKQLKPVFFHPTVYKFLAESRDITGHRAHAPPLPQCLADPRLP